MGSGVDICTLCAWRADCSKKFSVSGRDVRCADFVRDVSIEKKAQEKTDDEEVDRKNG